MVDSEIGAIKVTGKGNRQRMVYAVDGGPRPLLAPVAKGGNVQSSGMTS